MIALGIDMGLSGFLWDLRMCVLNCLITGGWRMCVFKCLIIGGWLEVHFCIQEQGYKFIGVGGVCLFGKRGF